MAKVFVTDYIDDLAIEKKILGHNVSFEGTKETEVLLVWHEKIDKAYLDKFPNLKGVVRYGVGFDTINLEDIRDRGLFFCNTPDYGTDEVSDTALAMMLMLLRGVSEYDKFARNLYDSWQENTIARLRRLSELRLGVIGAGRIGTALMRKVKAIGMKIVFFDPYKDSGYEKAIGVERTYNLNELLATSDVVSIHTPLNEETRDFVDESFINNMKQNSILINTCRGEVVKDLDLIYDSLLVGKISGVALDVLSDEPPIQSKLIKAWRDLDNDLSHKILINPHTSYYSIESYYDMRSKAAENAKRILDNVRPINIITDQFIQTS
jgi:C-terminal binding protein